MAGAQVIALLGAECTGKSTTAVELARALDAEGRRAGVVAEVLREFCDLRGRTPRRDEQHSIAIEQTRRIAEAALVHDVVVADTCALMIAVYSDYVFGDRGLYEEALQAHAGYGHTLLMSLDLPWQADGLQRDGAHVREPVDALVRAALDRAALHYCVVHGQGAARITSALTAVRHHLAVLDARPTGAGP